MPAPDLVLHGGNVITLDRASRQAEAVAIRGGRIVGVGASAALLAEAGPDTRCIDLAGRSVLPGFCDAHPHLDREGLRLLSGTEMEGRYSVAAICALVRTAAANRPAGEWIVLPPMGGPPHEWVSRPEQLREGRFPTRHDLDAAAPDHPVYIRAVWGWWSVRPFPSVANSRALALAGVTRDTPAPHNVEIVKDAHGEPTGVFLERNFVPVLEYTLFRGLPRFTYADRVASVRRGAAAYIAAGTTSAYEGHGLTPALIRAYREVAARGALPLRLHTPVSVPGTAFDDARLRDVLYHYAAYASERGTGDDRFRVEGVNFGGIADAEVGRIVGGDYPYEQWAGHFYQAVPLERYVPLASAAARLGLRLNCIVSRDLEYALRAFEAVDAAVPIRDRRWVVIHVNQATPEQIRRMRALGLLATVTPGFLYLGGDRYGLDQLGADGVPIRALLDAGVPVALGTDGVPYSMLWTAWEALARWDSTSGQRLGESGLTREEVLRLACQTGHLLSWSEDRYGAIEVGKGADLVVLAEDPLTCAEDRLKDIPVDLTIVGGEVVHERDCQAQAP